MNWSDISEVSLSSALLLSSQDKIRFVPDEKAADTASFSYYAWDQTSGTHGQTVLISDTGGISAFSTDTDICSINVYDMNDAPSISQIENQKAILNSTAVPISFTITDIDGDDLVLSAMSSNVTIVAQENMSFSATDSSRILMLTPTAYEIGDLSITVIVSDTYGLTSSTTFSLNVSPMCHEVVDVAAGFYFSVALKSDGTVWGWGRNGYMQIGDADTGKIFTEPVKIENVDSIKAITAGSRFVLALDNNGTVWAWGHNNYDQLGRDTTEENSSEPVQIQNFTNVSAIAAGVYHSIALKDDGSVWVWGFGQYGQIGNDQMTSTNTIPTATSLPNDITIIAISGGGHHVLALDDTGHVWAWGYNSNGQIGNGSNQTATLPKEVLTSTSPITPLTNIKNIAGGSFLSIASGFDGSLWTWGKDGYGMLGHGTVNTHLFVATQVQSLTDVDTITKVDELYTVILKSDGTIRSWGLNDKGQLGVDSSSLPTSYTPVPQDNPLQDVIDIASGYRHTLLLRANKTVCALGDNTYGQLGNGTTDSSSNPLTILNLSPNYEPFIRPISDQSTEEDTPLMLSFSAIDIDSAVCSMDITITSDNDTLIPEDHITFTCNENSYQLSITPANDQHGNATITVLAQDHGSDNLIATQSFNVSVVSIEDVPKITKISDRIIDEDFSTGSILFTLFDADADDLTVSVSSNNTTLLPIQNIILSGTGASRTINLTPTANEYGSCSITIFVTDGTHTISTAFEINVNAVNDAPVLTSYTPTMPGINEDNVNNAGVLVSSIIGSSIMDVDAGSIQGIAINQINSGNGRWEFSINNGLNWSAISSINVSSALLLSTQDKIRFVPDGKMADSASFSYLAWDQTSGSRGNQVDISSTGGITAFSIDSDVCSIIVSEINDSPIIAQNNGITVNEGSAITLTNQDLQITDPDHSPNDLIYTYQSSNPSSHGSLYRNQVLLQENDTFTQADIDNNIITYIHAGGETALISMQFKATDGLIQLSNIILNINVLPVNDSPQIISNNMIGLSEGATKIIGNTFLKISDDDNTDDELIFYVTQLPSYGFLSYSGTDLVVGDVFTQESINNSLLTYRHSGAETASDQFAFTITDGMGATLPETIFQMSITADNDTPVLVNNMGLNLSEGDYQIIGSGNLLVTDPDNLPQELTYVLSVMPAHGSIYSNGIQLTGNTFTQQNISNNLITYQHDGTENFADTFTFVVHDSFGASLTETVFTITIQPVNDIPQLITNSPLSLNEGESKAIPNTLLMASDPETSNLTYTITGLPDYGQLRKNGIAMSINDSFVQSDLTNGNIRFDHDGSEQLTDSFSFVVSDADGGMITETQFSIQIVSVNDAPVVNDFTFAINELLPNNTFVGQVTATDPDIPQQTITYSIVGGNTNSAFVIESTTGKLYIQNTSAIDYETTPGHQFELTVQAKDNGQNPANQTGNGIVTININNVNDAPVLSAINNLNVSEDQTISPINVQISDAETLPDNMTVSGHSFNQMLIPDHYIVISGTGNTKTIQLDLLTDQSGTAVVAITLTDAEGLSDSTQFTVVVQPVDDSPVVGQVISDLLLPEDAATHIVPLTNAFNDIDNDNSGITIQVTQNSMPSLLQTIITGNELHITPQANKNGSSTVVITAISNGKEITQEFNITVSPVDDPPYVSQSVGYIYLDEDDNPNPLDLNSTFSDIDNDPNAIVISILNNTNTGILTASISNHLLNLTLIPNMSGDVVLTLQAMSNNQYVTTTVSMTISPVDDPPMIQTPLMDVNVSEDAAQENIDLSTLFTDIDNDDAAIHISILNNSNTALVQSSIITSTLTLTFLPDQFGQSNLTLQGVSNGKTITDSMLISVSPIDDSPTIALAIQDITINEDSPNTVLDLTGHFTDKDNDDSAITLSLLNNSNPELVSASVDLFQLTLRYTENLSGTAEITVRATSNNRFVDNMFTIRVLPVDDPPTMAIEPSGLTINEDSALQTIDLSDWFTDIDNDDALISPTIIQNTRPDIITAQISDKSLQLNPIANANGDLIIYIAGNSNGLSVNTQMSVVVLPVNDKPTVSNSSISLLEDQTISSQLSAHDIDMHSLFYFIGQTPTKGIITLNDSNGIFQYTPNLNANGSDFFTFRVLDEDMLMSDSATISINITPVNDLPVINHFERQGNENIAYYYSSSDFSNQFSDVDSDSLDRIKIVGLPEIGTLRLNEIPIAQNTEILAAEISTLNYTPESDWGGTIAYTWLAFDGTAWSAEPARVTMTIEADPVGIGTIIKTGTEDQYLEFDASDLRNFTLNSTSYIKAVSLPLHGTLLYDSQKTTEDHEFDGTPLYEGQEFHIAYLLGGELAFLPDTNFNGFTSMYWRASKNDIWSDNELVKITILPVNDIPVVQDFHRYTLEDSNVGFASSHFTNAFTDIDGDLISKIRVIGLLIPDMGIVSVNQQPIAWNQDILAQDIPLMTYTPKVNHTQTQGFYWQAFDGTVWSDTTASCFIHLTPVADTPQSMTASTFEDTCSSPIVLKSHAMDGAEVQYFKISSILNGRLYTHDQTTEILSDTYIPYSVAQLGVSFCPDTDSLTTGLFYIESSENEQQVSAQSEKAAVSITIIPVDDPPYVANPMISRTATEDDPPTSFDIQGVFNDIDNDPNEIIYSIYNNSNTALISASISGTILKLTYKPDQSGEAQVTVLALSNGKTEQNSFTISVAPVDDPPTVNQPLSTVQAVEDGPKQSINLSTLFTDKDNDDALITKTILANSNPSLVQASIMGNTLSLTFQADQNGSASISIQGASNGKLVHTEVMVEVEPQDDPPVIAQQIQDVDILEDAQEIAIPLSTVFTDKDNDDNAIIHTIQQLTRPDICSASISNKNLIVVPITNQNGATDIVIQANSNGLTISTEFTLTITAIDDPPVVQHPLSVQTMQEDFDDLHVDLGSVFTDVDNDDSEIIISIQSNTGSTIIDASIQDNVMVLHALADQNGTAEIMLLAQSGNLNVTHSVAVSIIPVDDPPVVAQAIPAISVFEDAVSDSLDLSPVFTDIDNNTNNIIKQLYHNSNPSLVAANISGNLLLIDYLANQSGDATLIIIGQSNGVSVSTLCQIHVSPVNDAPIANTVSFVTNEDSAYTGILNANDLENDSLTFHILSEAGKGQVTLIDASTGKFLYVPDLNENGSDQFMFGASDQEYSSNTAQVNFTINPVNDAPQSGNFSVSGHENTELFFTSSQFNNAFTDIDGDTLQKIRVTGLPLNGTILLNNSEVEINNSLLAEHLSTLSFQPDMDWAGTNTLTYKASDGNLWSAGAGVVSITIVADIPDIDTINKTCLEDDKADFGAEDLANFVLNSTSWIRVVTAPEHGDLMFDPVKTSDDHSFSGEIVPSGFEIHIGMLLAGELIYVPDSNFNGLDTLTWQASKNDIWTDIAIVKINVLPVNDAPEISDIQKSGFEDEIISFTKTNFINAYSDIENDALNHIQLISLPDSDMGKLLLNGQPLALSATINASQMSQLIFSPENDIYGATVFNYLASDGTNQSTTAASIHINLTPVGDTPSLPQSITIAEDTVSDPIMIQKNPKDGQEVIAFYINHISGGNLFIADNTTSVTNNEYVSTQQIMPGLIFKPFENSTTTGGFDVWSSENGQTIAAQSDAAHVTVVIIPVDDPPIVVNHLPDVTINEDNPPLEYNLLTIFSDIDNDPALMNYQVISISNPDLLTASIVDQKLTLVFYANQYGTSDLSIAAISNEKTVQSTCQIIVNPIQDAPVVQNLNIKLYENTVFTGILPASDVDHDPLTFALVKNPDKGTISLNEITGGFAYTPNQYLNGSDSFTFNVFDGIQHSTTATVSVYITPVNNPPEIGNIEKAGKENTPVFFGATDFSRVFTDPDQDTLHNIVVTSLPENGLLRINELPVETNQPIASTLISQMNFMPSTDWFGETIFTWNATDGNLNAHNNATATITITSDPANLSMIVKTGIEDSDIIFTAEDIEPFNLNGTSYLKVVSSPQNGSLLYDYVSPSPDHEFTPHQLSEGQEIHVSVFLSGIMLYRPMPNFNGTETFLWKKRKNEVWTDDDMVKLIIFPQ
ncbi:MAG: tandem-95 repeat protein, partial [Candidatus Magnetomorum sp.]|nr:tandem-95 repeat protein [Candidatus Magnetomorum sp.]